MIRADKRKYHYIYKTTCIITNRYYIGMHSTENLEDGYKGSGKRLWHSIKKHGIENHVCEILEYLPSRKELAEREKEIINEELLDDDLCMNLALGGTGGFGYCNSILTSEHRKKNGRKTGAKNILATRKKIDSDPILRERYGNALSKGLKSKIEKDGFWLNQTYSNSKEAILKKKETFKKLRHQQGENNSQFGSKFKFIHKNGILKKVSLTKVTEYLLDGWTLGFIKQLKLLDFK